MNSLTLAQIRFCALECFRQGTDAIAVGNMAHSYLYALRIGHRSPNTKDIVWLGRMIEPTKVKGWRKIAVTFASGEVLPPIDFQRSITLLCESGFDLTPAEFYQEFEKIHPFVDGNGRVGAILFNWLNGTLDSPVIPPMFKR